MATTTTEPPDHLAPPDEPRSLRDEAKAHTLGLTSATGLVIGSIAGTGEFTVPAVLAGAGTMGIVVSGVIAVGAMSLAVLFGQLTKRVSNSDGGLYAYSRHEFADVDCLPSVHDRSTELGRRLFDQYGLDGAEVTDGVFESSRSIVFDEAENRAVLVNALAG